MIEPAGDFLPDGVLVIERLARLVDVRELDAGSQADFTGIGLLDAGQHAKQGGLAGTVRTNDADDATGRQVEIQRIDQQAIAITFT